MDQKKFFKQLKAELHGHPFRDRFLEELEDHAEDLEAQELNTESLEQRMGEPKQIKDIFIYIMNPAYKSQVLVLYSLSLIILLILWIFILNEVLVPWDVAIMEDKPPLGTWSRTLNDYFEGPQGGFLILIFSSFLVLILPLISFLNSYKNSASTRLGKLSYSGLINYFYLGFLLLSLVGAILLKVSLSNLELPYFLTALFWIIGILALPLWQYISLKKYQN